MNRPEDDGAPEPPTDDGVFRSSGDGARAEVPPGERLPDEFRRVGAFMVWSFG